MNLDLLLQTLLAALPAFGRVLGMLTGAPFFGQRGVPVQARVGLALLITGLFTSSVRGSISPAEYASLHLLQQATICAGELILGLAIGYIARMVFTAVQLAGHIVEIPMGLSLAGIFDPNGGGQVPVLGQFYYVLVAQMFFVSNGHLGLLRALGDSFLVAPAGKGIISEAAGNTVFTAFSWMFTIGLQVALPVVVAVLLTDVALGVAMRVVPQFNIFLVGFSVKIIAGFLGAAFAIVALVSLASDVFSGSGQFYRFLMQFVTGWRPQ